MPITSKTPLSQYKEWLEAHRSIANLYAHRDVMLANFRLLIFIAGIGIAVSLFRIGAEYVAWLGLPFLLFGILIVIHDRVLKKKERAERAVEFYEKGLARLEGRWAGKGNAGQEWMPEDHPYAEDLDIFGDGSLYELLCTVRTRMGEETLS
ncbi:MAG: hypothetical protein COA73_08430 [Candidatus Hydrogenedentota bacterium]|nr:MAG: hypothetical protein COA73_08430 [Candidatus Hydrogenedentota bacterium]